MTPVSSYFFVAEDEKVYPAGADKATGRLNRVTVAEIKNEVKAL